MKTRTNVKQDKKENNQTKRKPEVEEEEKRKEARKEEEKVVLVTTKCSSNGCSRDILSETCRVCNLRFCIEHVDDCEMCGEGVCKTCRCKEAELEYGYAIICMDTCRTLMEEVEIDDEEEEDKEDKEDKKSPKKSQVKDQLKVTKIQLLKKCQWIGGCPKIINADSVECPRCKKSLCKSHLFQCRDCQVSFCCSCLSWCSSPTGDSYHRCFDECIRKESKQSIPVKEIVEKQNINSNIRKSMSMGPREERFTGFVAYSSCIESEIEDFEDTINGAVIGDIVEHFETMKYMQERIYICADKSPTLKEKILMANVLGFTIVNKKYWNKCKSTDFIKPKRKYLIKSIKSSRGKLDLERQRLDYLRFGHNLLENIIVIGDGVEITPTIKKLLELYGSSQKETSESTFLFLSKESDENRVSLSELMFVFVDSRVESISTKIRLSKIPK